MVHSQYATFRTYQSNEMQACDYRNTYRNENSRQNAVGFAHDIIIAHPLFYSKLKANSYLLDWMLRTM